MTSVFGLICRRLVCACQCAAAVLFHPCKTEAGESLSFAFFTDQRLDGFKFIFSGLESLEQRRIYIKSEIASANLGRDDGHSVIFVKLVQHHVLRALKARIARIYDGGLPPIREVLA